MKKNIKYLGLFAIILAFFSCTEETNFKEPDIALVPVYAITNIVGANAPFAINVYKEKPLIIEYTTSVNPNSFTSSGYVDSSTATNFEFAVNKLANGTVVSYRVSADKVSGNGTLTVDNVTVYTIKVAEKQVYN